MYCRYQTPQRSNSSSTSFASRRRSAADRRRGHSSPVAALDRVGSGLLKGHLTRAAFPLRLLLATTGNPLDIVCNDDDDDDIDSPLSLISPTGTLETYDHNRQQGWERAREDERYRSQRGRRGSSQMEPSFIKRPKSLDRVPNCSAPPSIEVSWRKRLTCFTCDPSRKCIVKNARPK